LDPKKYCSLEKVFRPAQPVKETKETNKNSINIEERKSFFTEANHS
jgi:hypothetical protein